MKNLKIYAGLVALLLLSSVGLAQTSAEADKIVKAAKAKMEGLSDIAAEFTYTLSNPNMKRPVVKNGKAILSKEKYAITFPDEQMYCDGQSIWIVLAEDEEVTISCFDEEESISVYKVFEMYENSTKSRYDGVEDGSDKITLFSKGESDIFKTTIWISQSTRQIVKAQMNARNGSVYSYEMKNIRSNTGAPASSFKFDASAAEDDGWIVTDLRDDCQ